MKRIVLLHEIGHDQLHRKQATVFQEFNLFDMTSNSMEYEANIFAAELLISDDDMTEQGERGCTIEEAAAAIGVHAQVAMIKARSMQERGFAINVPYITNDLFKGA